MKKNNFINKIIYGLFNGMKSADKAIMSDSDNIDKININQNVEEEKLSKALLKGEVNDEVEDLRFRTYKVFDESKSYEYLANGKVVKKDNKDNISNFIKHDDCELILIQENSVNPLTFEQEVEVMNGKYIEREYTIKIDRKYISRYKLEEFCKKLVLQKIDDDNFFIDLYFNKEIDEDNYKSKGFINELYKIKNEGTRSDVIDIEKIWFITFNALNYNDLYKFSFNNVFFKSIDYYNNSIVVTFKAHKEYEPIHIIGKYYSNRVEKKYNNKEKKDVIFNLSEIDHKEYVCSECGKKINNSKFLLNGSDLEFYDAQITKETFGRVICKDCLKKIISIKETDNNA